MTKPLTPERNPKVWLWLLAWPAALIPVMIIFRAELTGDIDVVDDISWALIQGGMIFTGCLILANRPGNRVGRLILGAGVSFMLGWAIVAPMLYLGESGRLVAAGLLDAVGNSLASLWPVLLSWALFLFPTGRPPSPRWRWVTWLFLVGLALAFLAPLTNGGWGGDIDTAYFSNPLQTRLAPLGEIFSYLFFPTIALCQIASAVAVIVRFAASDGIERLQMKWLTYAMLLTIVYAPIDIWISDGAADGISSAILSGLVMFSLVSIAIGILKYRLFDIDRIISRTVGYALVVVLLGAVYVSGAVWLPARLIGDDVPPVFVAGSTLAVIALFNPVRRRVLNWVDRRFYRARYDAEIIVDSFSDRLRDLTDVDVIADDMVQVVTDTMNPDTVTIWVRD